MYRKIIQKIDSELKKNSIVLVQGSLEIGKTTCIQNYYSSYEYVSLKKSSHKNLIELDPYRFFNLYPNKTIFDDIEEIEGFLDLITHYSLNIYQLSNYILISNFKQKPNSELISCIDFLPFDIAELKQNKLFNMSLEHYCIESTNPKIKNYKVYLSKIIDTQFGKIVRIQQKEILLNVLKECALQINRPLNLNLIAKKTKVSQPTIQKWIETFEQLGLIVKIPALEVNFNKRIISSPKLFFIDNGFLAYLLQIKSKLDLLKSEHFSVLFFNFIIIEFYKKSILENQENNLYYWKESNGHEIKLIHRNPTSYDIFEIITKHEITKKDIKELEFFDEISDGKVLSKSIIYGGFKNYIKDDLHVISWQNI